jgi:hypothetical protein
MKLLLIWLWLINSLQLLHLTWCRSVPKNFTVCPTYMLKRAGEPDCFIALFLGKTEAIHTKCKRLLLNEPFDPVCVRSPDSHYWVYSLSSPQRVTAQCQEAGSLPTTKANYQIMIEGTGTIVNASSCYVHANNFKLLPHPRAKTTVDLTRGHLVLPNIDNILNPLEESLFQPDVIQPVDLQQVNDIQERAFSLILISHVAQPLPSPRGSGEKENVRSRI